MAGTPVGLGVVASLLLAPVGVITMGAGLAPADHACGAPLSAAAISAAKPIEVVAPAPA